MDFFEDAMEIVLGSLWVHSESLWVVMGSLRIVMRRYRIVVSGAAAESNGEFFFRIQFRILVFLTCVADACPNVPVEASRLPSVMSSDLCY